MITRVLFKLKHESKANLNDYEYHIDTAKHSVNDAKIKFKFALARLADKKKTKLSALLKYYEKKPDVKVVEIIK